MSHIMFVSLNSITFTREEICVTSSKYQMARLSLEHIKSEHSSKDNCKYKLSHVYKQINTERSRNLGRKKNLTPCF